MRPDCISGSLEKGVHIDAVQGGPPLPDADIETIKDWILDGASDWAVLPIPSVNHALSEPPIHVGDTFTVDISAETAFDLAKWQLDIAFDPAALEALSVNEGDFLTMNGGTTSFQGGSIDNAAGNNHRTQCGAGRRSRCDRCWHTV